MQPQMRSQQRTRLGSPACTQSLKWLIGLVTATRPFAAKLLKGAVSGSVTDRFTQTPGKPRLFSSCRPRDNELCSVLDTLKGAHFICFQSMFYSLRTLLPSPNPNF